MELSFIRSLGGVFLGAGYCSIGVKAGRAFAIFVFSLIILSGRTLTHPFMLPHGSGQAGWGKKVLLDFRRPFQSRSDARCVTAASDTAFTALGRWGWGPSYAVAQDSQFV